MLLFCPNCFNALVLAEKNGRNRLLCLTCPFFHEIVKKITFKKYTKLKDVEDALGGPDAWKNAQATNETCPSCEHTRAFYMELQTKSADEPTTVFYRCCECAHVWKTD
ncbi:hypothetical protein HELRODRAFT_184869 [Helobdella robusta]|uniref:DNA-directed RNA polymerase subunit n=1 Tax=Helobdella robusta TaxID=6412 RepID=T1FM37_HELRO|nr:hypothetical protein HELRODRAFT_184869 [Helobdella robusta]ESO13104.1 hypothetical protein HELRODRAFT_184869 [Helobdella robusta]